MALKEKEQLPLAASAPPDSVAVPPLTELSVWVPPHVVPMLATGVTPAGIVVVSATAVSGVAFGLVSVTLTIVVWPASTDCGERETVAVGAEIACAEFACAKVRASSAVARSPFPREAICAVVLHKADINMAFPQSSYASCGLLQRTAPWKRWAPVT